MDGEDTVMRSVLFYYVDRDAVVRIKDRAYAYAYAFYTTRWQEGYIRLSLRRVDGSSLTKAGLNIEQILAFEMGEQAAQILKRHDVQREIRQCIDTVQKYRSESSLVFTLLTDSHMTVNGTWKDTAATIKEVDDAVHPDAIMARLGVDAIITNYPDVAYEIVKGKKAPVSELRAGVEGKPQEKEKETVEVSRNRNPILHALE